MLTINFAIISVTRNDSQNLIKTRLSIESQNYSNWLHIIIDGASDSFNLDLIQNLALEKSILISEPDSGIYDAMNKGVRLVPEDYYVIFLNSGDELVSNRALEVAAESIWNSNDPEFLYSDFEQVDTNSGAWVTKFVARPNIYNQLYAYLYMSHQATILRGDLLKKLNGFDTKLKVAADWDLLLRALNVTAPVKMPFPLARFYTGGYSYQNIGTAHRELKHLRRIYLPRSAASRLYEYVWELVYLDFLNNKRHVRILKYLFKLIYRPVRFTIKLLLIQSFNFFLQISRKLNEYSADAEDLAASNLKIVASTFLRAPVVIPLQLVLLTQRTLYLLFINPILKLRMRLVFGFETRFRLWINRKLGLVEFYDSSSGTPS